MKVVACGPESSGTRLLHRLIASLPGVEAVHHSMPHGEEWWDWHEFEGHRFVIIVRRPDVAAMSAVASSCVTSIAEHRQEWPRAITMLAAIPDAYWVFYGALVADPETQMANIAGWLGVGKGEADFRAEVRNENDKWMRYL